MQGQTEQAASTIVSAAVASGAAAGTTQEQTTQTTTQQTQQTQQPTKTEQTTQPVVDKTVAAGDTTTTETTQTKPYWPEDWRQRVAEYIGGGDEKAVKRELKRLERFTDPNGIYAMSRELESKFSSGGLIKKPGKDAKPEEVAEFHKALGVPDKPEDYLKDVKLENGAVIGDADKPVIGEFVGAMHKAGAPTGVVQEALNWYYKNQEAQAAALDEADDNFRTEATRTLKEELGNTYKRTVNSVASVFAKAPGGVTLEGSLFARLMGGRTADGKIIGDDPDVVRFFASLAREINPEATVVDDAVGGGKSVETEIAEIEKVMRTDRRLYNQKYEKRYLELIGAREKIRARAR